jgi:hypothetical protein
MATQDVTGPRSRGTSVPARKWRSKETKVSFLTTEFWAMVAAIAAILIASAISDSLGDVRAWTLVAAVAIGYMLSRGLAKSGSKYIADDDRDLAQRDR